MIDRVKSRPFHAAALVLAVVLAVGVLTFAGPCVHDDGSHSVCFGAAAAIAVGGAIGAVVAIVSLAVRNASASGALALIAACCGAFAAAAPGNLLPLCMMQTMRCWTLMRPFALVCGACLLMAAVIAAASSFVSARRSRP